MAQQDDISALLPMLFHLVRMGGSMQQSQPQIIGYLKSGRPVVRNPDGSVSTHRNTIVNFDQDYYILPTMYGGKTVSPDEAVSIIQKNKFIDPDTGQKLSSYKSMKEAEAAEKALHDALEQEVAPYLKGQ